MAIRLKYRQGSFPREEERASESDAIARAGYLLWADIGCSSFQIVDHFNKLLKGDLDIRTSARESRHPFKPILVIGGRVAVPIVTVGNLHTENREADARIYKLPKLAHGKLRGAHVNA